MKKLALLLLCLPVLFFTSCTKESTADYSDSAKEILSQGQWTVAYYFAGQDQTSQYSNYRLNFQMNGLVTGTTGTTPFSGTWSVMRDVNYNDVIAININNTDPLLLSLNESWGVETKSTTELGMKGGTISLRLKKM